MREMRPALVVDRDNLPGGQDACGLGRTLARERQICAVELLLSLNGTREKDGDVDGAICLSNDAYDIE